MMRTFDLFRSQRLRQRLVVVLAMVMMLGCAGRQPGDPLTPGFNVYSKQDDIQLGQQAAAEIRRQVAVVEDQQLQDYVARLGLRLAEQPEAEDYPYSFTLINEPSINAFALPGGPIFIHSGLITAAETEGQLAGVLGHEIGHVVLRHGTNQASKATLIQLPAVLGGMAVGNEGMLGQLAQLGLGIGVNGLLMKYSRDAERQADAIGTQILAGAGYNPVEMANFFEKLASQGGDRPPLFFSTHPYPEDRMERVMAEITAINVSRDFNADTGQFARMKQRVARLPEPKLPQREQQAQQRPTQAPASGFETLNAGALRMRYPAEWQTYGDQQSGVITIAPRQGLVRSASGATQIGYGMVISQYRPQRARSLNGATQELVRELAEMNRSMRLEARPRQMNVQGNQALMTRLSGASPYGGRERMELLTIARPNGLLYMVFVAPEQDFQRLSTPFQTALNSLQLAR
jgi:Zn-dependent protease with chaperone function